MRVRARHIEEMPNALNICKAVSHDIMRNKIDLLSVAVIDHDYVRCIKTEKIVTCGYLKSMKW